MRVAPAVAIAVAAAALLPGSAVAARECQGLPVCIPVAGPWVVVAPRSTPAAAVTRFLMTCPRRTVAAGTDALVTDPALDVAFVGSLGSPVAPGVTTHSTVLFIGTSSAKLRRPTSFQPFLGCVPTSGGGGRSTTALAAVPPGQPLVRRARSVPVAPGGTVSVTQGCARGEHLVGSAHALAFPRRAQPPIEWLVDARGAHHVLADRVEATASRGEAIPPDARLLLQVQAVCARAP